MKIHTLFFSPTGTTVKICRIIENELTKGCPDKLCEINFTLPQNRQNAPIFNENDLVIVGVPVYAGRVPNILLKFLNSIQGNGAQAVAVALYGNRHYDDALLELRDILDKNGFRVIAGAAFIGEHSFSRTLAKNRPDADDLEKAVSFAQAVQEKIQGNIEYKAFPVNGNFPYRPYYRPMNSDGEAVDFKSIKPKTIVEKCNHCKLCVKICPMGSIDSQDESMLNGICIKCGACTKNCPTGAKYHDDKNYLRHKKELELQFQERREPEIFI